MIIEKDIDFGKVLIDKLLAGGYVKVGKLLVEVKRSTDDKGYIVDIFNNYTEELYDSFTIWDDQLEDEEDE